jgi:hypothetical protein
MDRFAHSYDFSTMILNHRLTEYDLYARSPAHQVGLCYLGPSYIIPEEVTSGRKQVRLEFVRQQGGQEGVVRQA